MIKLTVDGQEVEAPEGLTLLDVFRQMGVRVPTLCHHEAVTPYAACRLCLVEVTMGKRNMLTASCLYPASDGILVETSSERVVRSRRMVAELLLARCPDVPRVRQIAEELGIEEPRFPERDETCVLCGLCVRGCREIAEVGAIDFANRGVHAELVTPFKLPSEVCVGCSTCVYLCPTGSIRLEEIRTLEAPHVFQEPVHGAKCTLCGEYGIDHQFHGIDAASP
ncbi:MAG: 2Fe-2S iron-sulfur cluster-binding protein [Fidelibacterota bacterium]